MRNAAPGNAAVLGLASRSPRRAALLDLLGVRFETVGVDVDESPHAGEAPAVYVERVARAKAAAARGFARADLPLLAADTTVSVDGTIFGKPEDEAHARAMLRALSGRWHDVHTAVVLISGDSVAATASTVVTTQVEFARLGDTLIAAYWQTGEPRDKAGAYAIQGAGGALVKQIRGSYSAVVGLPLSETRELLDAAGIAHRLAPVF